MRIGSLYTVGMQLHKSKCQQCGKRFEHGAEYAYHVGERYYCSYRCMRAATATGGVVFGEGNKRYLSQAEMDRIVSLYDAGWTLSEIMRETGRSNTSVQRAIIDRRGYLVPAPTRKKEAKNG